MSEAPGAGGEGPGSIGTALGFAVAGWVLFAITGPIALVITWFADCAIDACPVATDLDRAVYSFDVIAWLAFPVLAFLAYRGRRWASGGILAIGVAITAQAVASMAGSGAFGGFGIVLPSGALIGGGGFLALGGLSRAGRGRLPVVGSELAGLGCLSVVVAVLALQGVLAGVGGPIAGATLFVAAILVLITILAFVNRDRPRPARPRPARRRGRRG